MISSKSTYLSVWFSKHSMVFSILSLECRESWNPVTRTAECYRIIKCLCLLFQESWKTTNFSPMKLQFSTDRTLVLHYKPVTRKIHPFTSWIFTTCLSYISIIYYAKIPVLSLCSVIFSTCYACPRQSQVKYLVFAILNTNTCTSRNECCHVNNSGFP